MFCLLFYHIQTTDTFPTPLTEFYNSNLIDVEFDNLRSTCDAVFITLTEEMSFTIEAATRSQTKCKLWYKYRSGRVTESRMKAACSTAIENPSRSLDKSICYPDVCSFSSKQTDWGTKKEKCVGELYRKEIGSSHGNLKFRMWGLSSIQSDLILEHLLMMLFPVHVMERGLLSSRGLIQSQDDTINNAVAKDNTFCLMEYDGKLKLRRDHTYYYQIQTQMHIRGVCYDFVVCTFGTSADIFVKRIFQDNGLWDDCLKTATAFFSSCILPELLGHWYTRPECGAQKQEDCQSESSDGDHLYCFCNQPSEGEMIGCDNLTARLVVPHKMP